MGFIKNNMWQIIEWEDDSSDTLVYRFPHLGKEIVSGSTLTVRPSQIALFVVKGKIADVFEAGKHTLNAKNLPIVASLGAIFFRGKAWPNQTELYFINTKQFTNQKWGTSRPMVLKDKDFGIIRIGAFGNYSFKVNDGVTLMKELFGTMSSYTVQDVSDYLKGMVVSTIQDTIAESKVSALEMYANLTEFGDMCAGNVRSKFNSIGLDISNFVIEGISFPESVEKAIDERASLGILADKMGTYTQKKAADAISDAAKNPGMAGTFMGIGLGQQAGGVVGSAFGSVANAEDEDKQKKQAPKRFCPDCGASIPLKAKFCPECGKKFNNSNVCPNCGKVADAGQKFCADCGTKL